MAETVYVDVKALTDESFAPYGQIVGVRQKEPNFHGKGLRSWRLDYSADDQTELMFIWFDHMPMRFSKLERHFGVTQAFVPLDGAAMVMVVAPRTDPANWADLPAPASVEAFLVPGNCGVMLWKGVWHALNRYPVRAEGGGFALLTSHDTQAELERELRLGDKPKLTQAVDYATTFNVDFEVRMQGAD